MTDLLVIDCADCGHPQETKRANARYCKLCRLFRDLIYLGSRKYRCSSCDKLFAPTNANDKVCAECDLHTDSRPRGRCAVCDRAELPLLLADVALCLYCAKDPSRRDTVTRAIGKKRHARIQEHDHE